MVEPPSRFAATSETELVKLFENMNAKNKKRTTLSLLAWRFFNSYGNQLSKKHATLISKGKWKSIKQSLTSHNMTTIII